MLSFARELIGVLLRITLTHKSCHSSLLDSSVMYNLLFSACVPALSAKCSVSAEVMSEVESAILSSIEPAIQAQGSSVTGGAGNPYYAAELGKMAAQKGLFFCQWFYERGS